MKTQKIILFFCVALPVGLLTRLMQLLFTVDDATGFYRQEYKTAGLCLLILIFAVCAVTVVLGFTAVRNPETAPRRSVPIALASLLTAVAVSNELLTETFSGTVMRWQLILLNLLGVLTAVYFALFGVSMLTGFRLPPLTAALPALYLTARIICTFTSISSLALISDNLILVAADCLLLLFFVAFGKLINDLEEERNFRRLLAFGLGAVELCVLQSVSHFVVLFITGSTYQHTSHAANFSLFATGLFTAVFLFTHFSERRHANP